MAFVESVAASRSGGLPARARTLAFCGYQGTVAYSMIGAGAGGRVGGWGVLGCAARGEA